MFLVKSFKEFDPHGASGRVRRASLDQIKSCKRPYTNPNPLASKYSSGLLEREASGLQSFTLAKLRRLKATSSVNPLPWKTLIRAAPSRFKTRVARSRASSARYIERGWSIASIPDRFGA